MQLLSVGGVFSLVLPQSSFVEAEREERETESEHVVGKVTLTFPPEMLLQIFCPDSNNKVLIILLFLGM